MYSNKILLKRKDTNYKAGFCIINEELPELEKRIALLHSDEKTYYETLKFERRKKKLLIRKDSRKTKCYTLIRK